MPIEGIDRKQLEELAEARDSVAIPASSLLALVVKLERLEEEITELIRNGRANSKPPSSKWNKPDKKKRKDIKGSNEIRSSLCALNESYSFAH